MLSYLKSFSEHAGRKRFAILCLVLALATVLPGCSSVRNRSESGNEGIEITAKSVSIQADCPCYVFAEDGISESVMHINVSGVRPGEGEISELSGEVSLEAHPIIQPEGMERHISFIIASEEGNDILSIWHYQSYQGKTRQSDGSYYSWSKASEIMYRIYIPHEAPMKMVVDVTYNGAQVARAVCGFNSPDEAMEYVTGMVESGRMPMTYPERFGEKPAGT